MNRPRLEKSSFSSHAGLVACVWQECHEASPFNGLCDGVLAYSTATGLTATDDATVTIYELLKRINIFVVHEHRSWTFAIDE